MIRFHFVSSAAFAAWLLSLASPVSSERIGESMLDRLQEHYRFAVVAAQNAPDSSNPVMLACFDTVYTEWERGALRYLSRTPLKLAVMQAQLGKYGSFMEGRFRDLAVREAAQPGIGRQTTAEIAVRRARGEWPASADARAIDGREIFSDALNANFAACIETDLKSYVGAQLPAPDLLAGDRVAERIQFRISWLPSSAGGVAISVLPNDPR